nr:hypothetical protein [Tanacetum cinerariifolium]
MLRSTRTPIDRSRESRLNSKFFRVPYMINGKIHYLTNDEINANFKKEDKIKKAAEEAKRFEMTKIKVIKIVQEEAEKIGIDPKKVISAKAGEKFKKAQDAEMQVHSPFKFSDFRVTELDELGPIIQKKKNTIVKDLMTSMGKRTKVLDLLTDVFGDQAFQRWNDIHKVRVDSLVSYLVMASMIKASENARYCLKLKKLIAEHHDQKKLQSKRVKLEAVGHGVNSHSVSYLQDAQPESIRKTIAFSEAILSE